MKGKRLLIMMLAVMLGITQVGMPVYGASSSDVLDGELGLEEWNECELFYGGNHDIVVVKGKEPTATEPGWTEHSYCKRCEKVFVAKVDLPPASDEKPAPEKHEHKQVIDKAVTATVDRNGKTSGIHCSSCNTVIVAQKTIARIDSIKLSATKLTYNGKQKSPYPVILDKTGKELVKDTDYSVKYGSSSRIKTGRYKVTVSFKGQYSGSKNLYFTIVPKAPSTVSAKLYGTDDVKVTWSKSTGASGYYVYFKKYTASDYTYLTRTTGTTAKKANLTDGIKYTFKVVPYYYNESNETRYKGLYGRVDTVYTLKKMAAPTVKRSDSKVKVSWQKMSGASGYHVEQYKKVNGKYVKIDRVYTTSLSKTFTASKDKTRYYRVRAYVKVDGVRKFATWSEMKSFRR